MSEIRSAAASFHTRNAQITQRTATLPNPLAVVMATGPHQPIKTPPLLSPLATAAAQDLRGRARHPILHRANVLSLFMAKREGTEGGTVSKTHSFIIIIARGMICETERSSGTSPAENTPVLFRLHKHLGAERKDVSPHPAS